MNTRGLKHSDLTSLAMRLNSLIDSGEPRYDAITLDQIRDRIEDGSVLRYVQAIAGDDMDFTDYMAGGVRAGFEESYVDNLRRIHNAYGGDEQKRWGVGNKGLCVLLAWTLEILQAGKGWTPNEA